MGERLAEPRGQVLIGEAARVHSSSPFAAIVLPHASRSSVVTAFMTDTQAAGMRYAADGTDLNGWLVRQG